MVRGIPGDWIVAALAADAEWVRTSRRVLFTSPARDQVRVMLEAAAPLIAAAERERGEASGDSLSDTLRYAVLLLLGICPTCGQRVAVTGAAEAEPR